MQCGNTDVALTWSPTTLWPPNHKLETVTINGSDTDNDSDNFSITIGPITESPAEAAGAGCGQPTSKQGPDFSGTGNTASGKDPDTISTTVQLRAERCAAEGDRTYDITVMCTDETAAMGTAHLTVTVPHDQGHH